MQEEKKAHKIKSCKPLILFGGARRDRTVDLLNAIQALSQLSYSPEQVQIYNRAPQECQQLFCAERRGWGAGSCAVDERLIGPSKTLDWHSVCFWFGN